MADVGYENDDGDDLTEGDDVVMGNEEGKG